MRPLLKFDDIDDQEEKPGTAKQDRSNKWKTINDDGALNEGPYQVLWNQDLLEEFVTWEHFFHGRSVAPFHVLGNFYQVELPS